MARIRYLKPEFFEDEDIASLAYQERLFYAGLWCHADKAGRLEDRPKRLKAVISPYDNVDPEKILSHLSQNKTSGRPFIQRYEVEGERYIQILQWEKHQSPHHTEKESEFPPAPPLKDKEKDKEKESISPSSFKQRINNGEITVIMLGEFKNVKLSAQEYSTLIERYTKTITDSKIEELSGYLQQSGKRYRSYYATLQNWIKRDGHKPRTKAEINKDFPPCPICKKETTKADIDRFGSCPSCFKPMSEDKLKELLGNIGRKI